MIAYGANASPARLIAKGLDRFGALLLPAVVDGWTTAVEDRTAKHGEAPFTVVRAPGHRSRMWALGLHPADLGTLDLDEGRGDRYVVGSLGEAAVAARWRLAPALAYGPGPATRLRPGETAEVAALADPPEGWPPTPLGDLDLFVYGTLQPDRVRWPLIADLVDVIGEASVAGTLVATPMRWPAALPDEGDGRIHGTLLRPRDPAAAIELYRRCDRIEDEGDLFERVAVRTDSGWAATYRWHPARGRPPGEPIADGRWLQPGPDGTS